MPDPTPTPPASGSPARGLGRRLVDLADAAIELPVVTSYTSIGPLVRRRLDHWNPIESYDAAGRVVVLTGATSGIGLAAARLLASIGATLVLVGRDPVKTAAVRDDIERETIERGTANPHVTTAIADMGDLDAVRGLADDLSARFERIHVLVHNAGALSATRSVRTAANGAIETTIASQVVGPFLLTHLLLDPLTGPLTGPEDPGRVITMSSGGMYSAKLTVGGLQMSAADYNGTTQYALAKRAQVTLNEMWAQRTPGRGVVFHAMHPGWADTPGVQESLPRFRTIMRPLLRTPESGADTLVWLAVDDGDPIDAVKGFGGFWLDRRRRSIHLLPTTRGSDTLDRRDRFWDWVSDAAGVSG